jgi:hypothetical protein
VSSLDNIKKLVTDYAHPDGRWLFEDDETVTISASRYAGHPRCMALVATRVSRKAVYRSCHSLAAGNRSGVNMCLAHLMAQFVRVRKDAP